MCALGPANPIMLYSYIKHSEVSNRQRNQERVYRKLMSHVANSWPFFVKNQVAAAGRDHVK